MRLFFFTTCISSILLMGCNNLKKSNKISGVWIFDNEINNLYLNDTSDFFKTQRPILFDFQNSKKLLIKNYSYKDTSFIWSLKNDSILMISDLEYTIHRINRNNLTLIDYNRPDTFWMFLKKPRNISINYSKEEISNILISENWTNEDTIEEHWDSNFEYFDNGTVLYRYKIFDKNFKDSLDNLQLETWGIAEYKNYFFLYGYADMRLGNGNIDRINQIVNISPESYTLTATIDSKIEEFSYLKKNLGEKRQENIEKIKGNWISSNTKEKNYGNYLPERAIADGFIELLEGDLRLNISNNKLSFEIDSCAPLESNWRLGKEGRTLILEYEIDEPEVQGINVKYVDILELSDTRMKLRLFNNHFYTGQQKPERYILNLIQEFEKEN